MKLGLLSQLIRSSSKMGIRTGEANLDGTLLYAQKIALMGILNLVELASNINQSSQKENKESIIKSIYVY